jgi:hypothetical protein
LKALPSYVPLKCKILYDLIVMFLLWWAASIRLGFLQFCNFNIYRLMFIVDFSLFLDLSIPLYFSQSIVLTGHSPVQIGSTSVCIYLTWIVTYCYKTICYLIK